MLISVIISSKTLHNSSFSCNLSSFPVIFHFLINIFYLFQQKSQHTLNVDQKANENDVEAPKTVRLNEDNKGFKMMKMLGWSGGSLGVSGNGIEEPISIQMKIDRTGLGLSSSSSNSKRNQEFFTQYLTEYQKDDTATYDLVFSTEFTKDERKSLHE